MAHKRHLSTAAGRNERKRSLLAMSVWLRPTPRNDFHILNAYWILLLFIRKINLVFPCVAVGKKLLFFPAASSAIRRRVLIKFCPRCHRRHPLNSRQKQNQQQNTGQTADFASSFPVHRFSSSFFPFGIPTGSSTSKTVPCRSLFTRTCP